MRIAFGRFRLNRSIFACLVIFFMCAGAFAGAAEENITTYNSEVVEPLLPTNNKAGQTGNDFCKGNSKVEPVMKCEEECIESIIPENEPMGPWPTENLIDDQNIIDGKDSTDTTWNQENYQEITSGTEFNSISSSLEYITEKKIETKEEAKKVYNEKYVFFAE